MCIKNVIMNIDEKILTSNGLTNIWELAKNENILVTGNIEPIRITDKLLPNFIKHKSNHNFLVNGISFFGEDCVVHKNSNYEFINTDRISELYNLFNNGEEISLLKSDGTFDKIKTFEYYEIENINKYIQNIHFYFGSPFFIFYSNNEYLIKTDTYYIQNSY